MDIYVVDTNCIFSALLNPESNIAKFISNISYKRVKLYAPEYLKVEIERHFDRLVAVSMLEPEAVHRRIEYVYFRIQFIPEKEIPIAYLSRAADFVRDVDFDDVFFVALAEFIQHELWTGDRRLYNHLLSKGYQRVIKFEELKLRYPDS